MQQCTMLCLRTVRAFCTVPYKMEKRQQNGGNCSVGVCAPDAWSLDGLDVLTNWQPPSPPPPPPTGLLLFSLFHVWLTVTQKSLFLLPPPLPFLFPFFFFCFFFPTPPFYHLLLLPCFSIGRGYTTCGWGRKAGGNPDASALCFRRPCQLL